MGLENAVFQLEGGAGLGLTYVTGALVKAGQLIAAALTGGAGWAWLPNLLLWAALVAARAAGGSGLPLDQSRRDLVCRSHSLRAQRAGCGHREADGLTARLPWPMSRS